MTPSRSITRFTVYPHHGRQIALHVPPQCDTVTVRLKGTRTTYDVSVAAIYDMAVKQHVAAKRAAKRRK